MKRSPLNSRNASVNDAIEQRDLESLFDENIQREIARHRAADGQIVDRTVHSEHADVSAGELQRLHGEAVGSEYQVGIGFAPGQYRCIGLDVEVRIAQMAGEHRFDQLAHESAAVAVRQCDVCV
jgi:hypothetical protein